MANLGFSQNLFDSFSFPSVDCSVLIGSETQDGLCPKVTGKGGILVVSLVAESLYVKSSPGNNSFQLCCVDFTKQLNISSIVRKSLLGSPSVRG